MTIAFVDLSSDADRVVRSMEAALRVAEATVASAAVLVEIAEVVPERLAEARSIYFRAKSRVEKLQEMLDFVVGGGQGDFEEEVQRD